MRKLIKKFYERRINVQVLKLRNFACRNCASLPSRDSPELYCDANAWKLNLIVSGVQPEQTQRQINRDSPIIEIDCSLYGNVNIFKSGHQIYFFVHVLNWHQKLHHYRIQHLIALFFSQIYMLKLPQSFSILTSIDSLNLPLGKEIMRTISLCKSWTTDPKYEVKSVEKRTVTAFITTEFCGCPVCFRIEMAQPCPVAKYIMLFRGTMASLEKDSRADFRDYKGPETYQNTKTAGGATKIPPQIECTENENTEKKTHRIANVRYVKF